MSGVEYPTVKREQIEQVARLRLLPKAALHQRAQPVGLLAHVARLRRHPDSHPLR